MKTEKIAVYSLTAALFSLMMLVLPKTPTWYPTYFLVIRTLLIFLLALTGGNIALIIFEKKMTVGIAAGIMAILLFPLLLIRSKVLFIFTLMVWAPATVFLIAYSLFRIRSHSSLMNLVKILAAGVAICFFYLSAILVIVANNPEMSPGEYGGVVWLVIGLLVGCIEIIVLIVALRKNYALQKDENQRQIVKT